VRGTRIVISALSEKGQATIKESMVEDIRQRSILKKIPKKFLSDKQKSFMKTVSIYIPKKKPLSHEILGFSMMSKIDREVFYEDIKKTFFENGCTIEDFEVRFYDS